MVQKIAPQISSLLLVKKAPNPSKKIIWKKVLFV